MWTKRRMLDLPCRDELFKLFWTIPIEDLANRFKVARGTMALIANDHKIPLPEKGHWQKRAAGKSIVIPDEVAKAFPDGLPKYVSPVGRKSQVDLPPLAAFLTLIWQHSLTELGEKFNCTVGNMERIIKRLKLPKPGHSYWRAYPKNRTIPERVKYLLTLDSAQLEADLGKPPPDQDDIERGPDLGPA